MNTFITRLCRAPVACNSADHTETRAMVQRRVIQCRLYWNEEKWDSARL